MLNHVTPVTPTNFTTAAPLHGSAVGAPPIQPRANSGPGNGGGNQAQGPFDELRRSPGSVGNRIAQEASSAPALKAACKEGVRSKSTPVMATDALKDPSLESCLPHNTFIRTAPKIAGSIGPALELCRGKLATLSSSEHSVLPQVQNIMRIPVHPGVCEGELRSLDEHALSCYTNQAKRGMKPWQREAHKSC